MATDIDIVDDLALARAVQKIFAEANRKEERRSSYFQGIILTWEECRLLWQYLQVPRHGYWVEKKAPDEEE